MTPRNGLYIGLFVLLIGFSNAIRSGGLATPYGQGSMAAALVIGLAVIYFAWYRRRNQ